MEFASSVDYHNLEEVFLIPTPVQQDQAEIKTSIWIEPSNSAREFTFVLERNVQSLAEKKRISIKQLPVEMERLIYGYLKSSNTIRIKMILPDSFPLQSPRFELESAIHKSSQLQTMIETLNCQLRVSNSPAHSVKSLLLILVSRILEEIE